MSRPEATPDRPSPRSRRSADLVLVPMGLVWVAASGMFTFATWRVGTPSPVWIMGLVYVAFGLWIAGGRHLAGAIRRRARKR